jgi:predicted lipoprotein with Yx(FWY)xxD motif
MHTTLMRAPRSRPGWLGPATVAAAALVTLAACSSSGSKAATTTAAAAASTATTAAPSSSANPGTMFGTTTIAGLGTVLVDASGKTVYLLTADGKTNATCDDASGCTKVWPDLPFPTGTTAATAGTGVQASLLGSMAEADGQTYPTYHGWLMYEFSGDSGPGTAHGQGLKSFGGTWSAVTADGTPATGTPTG